ALPVLFEGDFDTVLSQVVERGAIVLMRDTEGVVDAAVVLGTRIDRRIAPNEDQAGSGRIEKRHRAARHGREMLAADDLGVKSRALLDIADWNAEMHDRLDRRHSLPPGAGFPKRLACRALSRSVVRRSVSARRRGACKCR